MRTDYLRYFLDVARLGSITLAAERHFMSPQGISRAVSVLEGELGTRLFKRTSKNVSLTPAGEKLLPYAQRMVELEQEAEACLQERAAGNASAGGRLLRARCSHIAFDTPLFYPLADGARSWFGKARFLQQDTRAVVSSLLADVASAPDPGDAIPFGLLCLFDVLAEENARALADLAEAGFTYLPLLQTYDLVLMSDRNPLAAKRAIARADLRSYPLAVSGDLAEVARHLFGEDAVYAVSTDRAFRVRLALMDEAVTFIPGFALSHQLEKGVVARPLQDPWMLEVGAVAMGDLLEGSFFKEFARRITEAYGAGDPSLARVLI